MCIVINVSNDAKSLLLGGILKADMPQPTDIAAAAVCSIHPCEHIGCQPAAKLESHAVWRHARLRRRQPFCDEMGEGPQQAEAEECLTQQSAAKLNHVQLQLLATH
jgi:hypothetical protein